MKRWPTILVALLVIGVLVLYAVAFQVRFTETAVVTRFNNPVDREIHAGLNFFRAPWPIERVYKYDKRLRTFQTEPTQLSTGDQNTVTVTAFATWRIADAGKFLKTVEREDAAGQKIGDLLKNAVSKVLKSHLMTDLVNTDPTKIRFRDIEAEIKQAVEADVRNSYGIEVAAVGIARLGLPEKNTSAVAERMKAERKAVADRLIAEGDAEAKRIIENALAVADKIRARARSYATTIEGDGERLAAQHYAVFKENADLAAFLKRMESLENLTQSGETTLVIDAERLDPFQLLRMDLAPLGDTKTEKIGMNAKGQ